MSGDLAIQVENLSKLYHIGRAQQRHDTLRDVIGSWKLGVEDWKKKFRHPASRLQPPREASNDTIWALKDVSFEVKHGEVLGIIGRNGAGKSTLLKILSRVTEPTSGQAILNGRVGSLLEVGTGFHPELTGRENIYLNGAILGMKRAEINRRFDEIVAFAEVEKFLDTPVKRYSSGMYVRLAFAVAAHLEPEILVVDEVLAVGDAAFQKKCLGKMKEIGSQGRTVLFVSHNMSIILRLCERAVLLVQGTLIGDGKSEKVAGDYMRLDSASSSAAERLWPILDQAPGDSVARLHAVRLRNQQEQVVESIDIKDPVFIEVVYWNLQTQLRPTAILHLLNEEGICIFATNDFNNTQWRDTPRVPGLVKATCTIPGNFLAEGRFSVLAAIGTYNPDVVHAMEQDAITFQVIDRSESEGVRGVYAGGNWPGMVRPMLKWTIAMEQQSVQSYSATNSNV